MGKVGLAAEIAIIEIGRAEEAGIGAAVAAVERSKVIIRVNVAAMVGTEVTGPLPMIPTATRQGSTIDRLTQIALWKPTIISGSSRGARNRSNSKIWNSASKSRAVTQKVENNRRSNGGQNRANKRAAASGDAVGGAVAEMNLVAQSMATAPRTPARAKDLKQVTTSR